MSAGIRVHGARAASLPEMTGDAAILFDPRRPADIVRAIEAIEGDHGLGERLAAAGLARAPTLGDVGVVAKAYLDLFSELITRPNVLRDRFPRRIFSLRWAVLGFRT